MFELPPLVILAIGIVTVLGLIIALKVNAFIALITAAIVVSILAPGEASGKIARVASAFGNSAGGIGIVIGLAAVIGKCMLDSGAADRVVRAFLSLLGEKRAPVALMGSGFVLAVPVFFDTVFYLLVPLARSMYRRTGKQYLKYVLAIAAGGAITHTLVPPTPGPLLMASNLGFDVGWMIMVGLVVGFPSSLIGLAVASWMDHLMPIPMRQVGTEPEPEPLDDAQLPSLLVSILPVVLPVILISTNTVLTTIADDEHAARLTVADVRDWDALREQVQTQNTAAGPSPGKRVIQVLSQGKPRSEEARQNVIDLLTRPSPATFSEEERAEVVAGLNQFVLPNKDFPDEDSFLGIKLNGVAKSLLRQDRLRMKVVDAERMNRALLESALNSPDHEVLAPPAWETPMRKAADISSLFGDANLALLISTVIAMWVLVKQRRLAWVELASAVEIALMSGGVIILITAGGGAFGAMLKEAQVGDAIRGLFQISEGAGLLYLLLGFFIAVVLKIAQGSSTVAMITASAMLAGVAQPETLHFHPVYLATAIGAGSLVGSWMNDSGFWIFAKMGGLTEVEALKSWTVMLVILGFTSLATTVVLAMVLPLV